MKKNGSDNDGSPVVLVDSTSDESDSMEDGVANGSCSKMIKIFKVSADKFSAYEFDSKVGLNCS